MARMLSPRGGEDAAGPRVKDSLSKLSTPHTSPGLLRTRQDLPINNNNNNSNNNNINIYIRRTTGTWSELG